MLFCFLTPRRDREGLLRVLWTTITSPFGKVRFLEGYAYVGDILTSSRGRRKRGGCSRAAWPPKSRGGGGGERTFSGAFFLVRREGNISGPTVPSAAFVLSTVGFTRNGEAWSSGGHQTGR
ncbi:hypothetical protein Esi_0191_0011 [Ectocarpus siliculosus]|uniref:Uncharacterized protein n=1 Tax=Ectocarpus siliculosus TaxID=2880 RepID=D8LHD1_ECTSI|nr:hypothetical protein Esi_0191_0011 [Ectocarpus siliculosus]|eukprot:CBN80248.1 hypothetical protein Esi_0191_0011 [Ectocarpus siliculosus]